jgi:hypothetical protein
MPSNHQAASTDEIAHMSDSEFVAAFAELSIEEFDALTVRLFAGRRSDDEALASKYRAMADRRVKDLHRFAPEIFY